MYRATPRDRILSLFVILFFLTSSVASVKYSVTQKPLEEPEVPTFYRSSTPFLGCTSYYDLTYQMHQEYFGKDHVCYICYPVASAKHKEKAISQLVKAKEEHEIQRLEEERRQQELAQIPQPIPTVTTQKKTSIKKAVEASYVSAEWDGQPLTSQKGRIKGPSGTETYYNLPMDKVVANAKALGIEGEHWVRDDGVKMLGDYIMIAANLEERPKGTLVETSLGTGVVVDSGAFAKKNKYAIDIATSW